MRKLSADDFLRITAQFSISNDKVRTICEDGSYLTVLGLFTAKWCKEIFAPNGLFDEVEISENLCDEAWHNAFIDVFQMVKVFGLDKEVVKQMFSEYIGEILYYLFPEDDFEEYDVEDDVDETFYNPYTGSEEFEGSEDFGDA